MSYPRIQQVLGADSVFADRTTTNDTEITLRCGEKELRPALVVNVFNALKAAGCNMQSVAKTTILATAARLSNGEPVPTAAPAPAAAVAPAKVARKKEAESPTAPAQLKSTSRPVVVTTARAGAPRPIVPERPIDQDVVHRYQCAVAGAQLLAALHQLFEKDDFPGHETRRKKLDDLISEVEQSSSLHVNLSVKAIIRAQTSTKHQAQG